MIPEDCIPTGNKIIMEIITIPDKLGRCMFNLYWNVKYIPGHPSPKENMTRGQCFFAVPSEYDRDKTISRPWE